MMLQAQQLQAAQKDLEKLAAEIRACDVQRGERLSDADTIARLDRLRAAVARKAELEPIVSGLLTKSPALFRQFHALLMKLIGHPFIGDFLPRVVEMAQFWKGAFKPDEWFRLKASCPNLLN